MNNDYHDSAFGFIAACIAGAIVSALSRRDITPWQRMVEAVCGSVAAYYGGAAAVHLYAIPTEYISSAGFALGLIGMEMARMLIEFARSYGPMILRKKTNLE